MEIGRCSYEVSTYEDHQAWALSRAATPTGCTPVMHISRASVKNGEPPPVACRGMRMSLSRSAPPAPPTSCTGHADITSQLLAESSALAVSGARRSESRRWRTRTALSENISRKASHIV